MTSHWDCIAPNYIWLSFFSYIIFFFSPFQGNHPIIAYKLIVITASDSHNTDLRRFSRKDHCPFLHALCDLTEIYFCFAPGRPWLPWACDDIIPRIWLINVCISNKKGNTFIVEPHLFLGNRNRWSRHTAVHSPFILWRQVSIEVIGNHLEKIS